VLCGQIGRSLYERDAFELGQRYLIKKVTSKVEKAAVPAFVDLSVEVTDEELEEILGF
jgi:hypothetical protein